MNLILLTSLFVALVACQDIAFVNPPPGGDVGEYSQNPTFVLGSVINIQWTAPEDKELNMVLYQDVPEAEFEYVFSGKTNESSFRWNVGTSKSLSKGNVFFMQIFVAGDSGPTAGCHYFNLTRGSSDDDSSTSSTTSSAKPTSTLPTSITSGASIPADAASSTPSSTVAPKPTNDGGLSTGAKVGMGVGIPVAIILGLAAGWFIFGRKKKPDTEIAPPESAYKSPLHEADSSYATPHEGYYAPNAMSEQSGWLHKPTDAAPTEIYTPPAEPVEMPGHSGTAR